MHLCPWSQDPDRARDTCVLPGVSGYSQMRSRSPGDEESWNDLARTKRYHELLVERRGCGASCSDVWSHIRFGSRVYLAALWTPDAMRRITGVQISLRSHAIGSRSVWWLKDYLGDGRASVTGSGLTQPLNAANNVPVAECKAHRSHMQDGPRSVDSSPLERPSRTSTN